MEKGDEIPIPILGGGQMYSSWVKEAPVKDFYISSWHRQFKTT